MGEEWARRRREDAAAREDLLRRRRDAEHERARALLVDFAAAARTAGLTPQPLRVHGYGGGSARTALTGWPLRQDGTAAVAQDGTFYLLTADLSVRDRLLGASPVPADPPLVLGAGGRDGDSISLADALERLLPGWRDRPPMT